MSEPQRDYLTVSQAAARLGISERTLRKRIKAGEVEAEKRAIDGGGVAWHVQLSQGRAGSEPEAERKNEPEARRKSFESESASERKRAGSATETAPEVSDTRAGSEPEAGLLAHLQSEVLFLRAAVEQRDRDAAELRAALRKALEAMPKALTSGDNFEQLRTEKTARENAPQPPIIAPADLAHVAQNQANAQRAAKPRKLTGWQRAAARILGIR